MFHEALVANPGCRVLHIARGVRSEEIGFSRFLRNPRVTVAALSTGAAARTAERVSGRHVLALQDTSEIVIGGRKARGKGFGPVGGGGNLGDVLLHPVLAVDAFTGELLGLVNVSVWNREGGKRVGKARERPKAERESQRWLDGAEQASQVLAKADSITVVSDREGDIYDDFARRPDNMHLLTRVKHDRKVATDAAGRDIRLSDHVKGLAEAARFTIDVPAAPGRAARKATFSLRFGPVKIKVPASGMSAKEIKALPPHVALHFIEVREIDPPDGIEPLHWRLWTSHEVADVEKAKMLVGFYRKRWIIEEYFRTLKTAGFQIEDSEIGDPAVLMNFVAMAAIAAVTVTQLLRARDNPGGQSLLDAFDTQDMAVLEAVCDDYEGPHPTPRQRNPHPKGTMAYAAWVIARLGAWTGYYGKPGPRTLNRGLQKFRNIRYGAALRAADV